jgi:hypothetical protein
LDIVLLFGRRLRATNGVLMRGMSLRSMRKAEAIIAEPCWATSSFLAKLGLGALAPAMPQGNQTDDYVFVLGGSVGAWLYARAQNLTIEAYR